MQQIKESGIPTKAQAYVKAKSNSSNGSKSSSNCNLGDDNWVTIKGNLALFDK